MFDQSYLTMNMADPMNHYQKWYSKYKNTLKRYQEYLQNKKSLK